MTKPLDQYSEADLQQLIADSVMEGKQIEYKRMLNLEGDESKRKFLASIASFANASGGLLVFGIMAENGKPVSVSPLPNFDPDDTKLKLVNLIRDGIQPKVFALEFKEIAIAGGYAFAIRIPKTYAGAHMVTYNKDNRFYARAESGGVMMDVAEVRTAFTLADTTTDKIRKWRMERIANILADETPCKLTHVPRIVMHVMPLRAFDPAFKADLSFFSTNRQYLVPIYCMGFTPGRDFDGVFTFFGHNAGLTDSYAYLLRNGCVEGVDVGLLKTIHGAKVIPSVVYEEKLFSFLSRALELLKLSGSEPPFFVSLSLLNVRGFGMSVPAHLCGTGATTINKDHLYLPEVFLESFQLEPSEAMRESFNMIWNACGWPKSLNYDQANKWIPQA